MKKYRTDDLRQMTPLEMKERLDDVNAQIFRQRNTLKLHVVYGKGEPSISMLKKIRKQILTVAREKGFDLYHIKKTLEEEKDV